MPELDDVEGVEHGDRVLELVVDGVPVAVERVQGGDLDAVLEVVAAFLEPVAVRLPRPVICQGLQQRLDRGPHRVPRRPQLPRAIPAMEACSRRIWLIAHQHARTGSKARGRATCSSCSVNTFVGHDGSSQRQVRLRQINRTGRSKHSASTSATSLRP